MIYIATLIILLLCIVFFAVGYLITKKPFKNHCTNKARSCDCDEKTPPCESRVMY